MLVLRLKPWSRREYDLAPRRVRLDVLGREVESARALLVDGETGEFHALAGFAPVRVNGEKTHTGMLFVGDVLESDDFSVRAVEVERPDDLDPSKRVLVLETDQARAVWCDELKLQGFVLSAEYLELSARVPTPEVQARLAELIPLVARDFRAAVGRTPIRGCTVGACPSIWDRLPPHPSPERRRCIVCNKQVAWLEDMRLAQGEPFALEPGVPFNPSWLESGGPIVGRPLVVDGAPRVAPFVGGEALTSLAQAAQAEHASIAAFARTLCELMALGAPLDLLERTQQALADELRHTAMTLEQLRRRGENAPPFGPLPEATASLARSLEAFIEDVCSGGDAERRAVERSRQAARNTLDPSLRAFHETLAADEARHVQLAIDTVAWLRSRVSA